MLTVFYEFQRDTTHNKKVYRILHSAFLVVRDGFHFLTSTFDSVHSKGRY